MDREPSASWFPSDNDEVQDRGWKLVILQTNVLSSTVNLMAGSTLFMSTVWRKLHLILLQGFLVDRGKGVIHIPAPELRKGLGLDLRTTRTIGSSPLDVFTRI